MKVGIMQPYLFPYTGYFQLITAVDKFVIYDNIEYTKKGWINRNRFLQNGEDTFFTLPLKKDSDYLDVRQRRIADDYNPQKILNKIYVAYRKAPYFDITYPLFQKVMENKETNLFEFVLNSIKTMVTHLDIKTDIVISSTLDIDHSLKSQDKVLTICNELQSDCYINAIGGIDLYSKEVFKANKIELSFIKSKAVDYKQFDNSFVPLLSIIDALMFNSIDEVKRMLQEFELV